MGKYAVEFEAFASPITTPDTAIGLDANATTEWAEVVELLMTGSGTATAADRQHRAQFFKSTFATAGTGTIRTAEPFDEGSAAADLLATVEFTAEPTVIGARAVVNFGFNQRGGMRWAVPRGEGIILSGVQTDRGGVFTVVSDAAGEVDGHAHWHEP